MIDYSNPNDLRDYVQNIEERLRVLEELKEKELKGLQERVDIVEQLYLAHIRNDQHGGGILSGPEIHRLVKLRKIFIDPFDEGCIGPNSYDLHLGDQMLFIDDYKLDMHKAIQNAQKITIPPEGFTLQPGYGYLAHTVEIAGANGYVPWIDGRSTTGRYFVKVHHTAGRGDDGFIGQWTLEISSEHRPVVVYPNDPLCQVTFFTLIGARKPYRGRYQHQFSGPKLPIPFK